MKKQSLIILLFTMIYSNMVLAQQYDIVILNGRVMDPETMYDQIANVGIKDGIITAITKEKITGKETVDAIGLVVSPGWIDTHFHAVDLFATKLALRDGTTTGMDLELGATNVGEWYAMKDRSGWQVNYGTTSSHNGTRIKIHDPEVDMTAPMDYSNATAAIAASAADGVPGWSVTRSNIDQMNEIIKLMDEDLRQGALGVGVGAAYAATGLTTYEQFEVQKIAARYGRPAVVHTRFHVSSETPTEAQIGYDEVLINAMLLDAPLLMAHDNDYGWWEIEEKLRMARAKGYNVWSEYYAYDAGSTPVSADFLQPKIWEETYGNKYEETIYAPQLDKFLTKDEYFDLKQKDPGQAVVVFFKKREKWMPFWLRVPHMVVATDAMAGVGTDGKLLPWDAEYTEYAGHPRTAGAMAKSLRLGREQGVPLMFTISQLTYWTALHLGDTGLDAMKERGRVQVGKVADLTLFDPLTVTDNATYKAGENGLPSTGIPYVIVNGTIVVKDSEVLAVKPGKPIRFPVESKGRFIPIDVNAWLNEYTIGIPAMPAVDDTGAGKIQN